MWFSQYGQLWDGPWFLITGEPINYAAGIMQLNDLPAASLATSDL